MQNKNEMQSVANWYSIFRNSINNGVLRKNTVFSNQSVNGYIYIPIKDKRNKKLMNFGNDYYDIDESENQNKINYSLKIKTKERIKNIKLKSVVMW